ncbi:DUF4349 domain-containing protein [Methanoregula sp.]|uniref:DUF4349 domain-containing protein n=1 Tax=Methanoregula sp. TaxID=2052170 RepID=UPI003565060D
MKYPGIALLIVLCIVAVAAAGCMGLSPQGSGQTGVVSETASRQDISMKSGVYTSAGNAVVPIQVSNPVSATSGGGTTSAVMDTKIIRTASLTIEVPDVTGAAETLKGLVTSKGGYVSSTSIQKTSDSRLYGTVVLRVPASAFDDTLAGIKGIGTVRSVSAQSQDVTEEYVDLVAQKTSYQNQLAQYNTIMKKAENVEDVITVQQQIDRVQTELDRLEGRLKYLNSRVDLSTITVTLQEPEPVGGETGHNFVSTLNEGIAGFLGMIDALIVILFTLLPLIIIGGAAYGIYRWKKGKKPAAVPTESKETQ